MRDSQTKVTLRALEPEDLDLFYRIENDETLWGIGPTNVPYSRFMLHQFMSDTTGDIYTDKQVRLVIEDAARQVVGMVDLMAFDPKNLKAEMGIVIMRPYRRKGYAKAAIEYVQHYARNTLHLHQLYVIVSAHNEASLHIFRQLGYRQTGILSDWLYDGTTYHDAAILQLVLA